MSRPRTLVLVVTLAVVIIVVAVAYTFYLAPAGGHSLTTSTVSTPANLLAITGQLPEATCGEPNGTYGNSSLAINWGNLAPGTKGIQYLCLRNTGTTPVTLTITSNLPASVGKVTSPQIDTILNGGGTEEFEIDLYIASSVQTGPISSFTITLGGGA